MSTELDLRVRTRVSMAVQAATLADLGRGVVGDTATSMPRGQRIRAARRVRMAALTLVDRAVIAELADGATWDEIAAALTTTPELAEHNYAQTWQDWCDGTLDQDDAAGAPETNLTDARGVESTAETLDSWHARHAEPWEAIGKPPLAELLIQAGHGADDS